MGRTNRAFSAFIWNRWLTGLFVILLGLAGCRSASESEPTEKSSSPLSSPLGTVLASPLPMTLASPLPTPSLTPSLVPSLSPTVRPTIAARPETALALGVLHTNDTWGYLLPCG